MAEEEQGSGYLDAPRVGRLVVGLSVDPDGAARVASLVRTNERGESTAHALKDAASEARIAELERALAQERSRAAGAEKALAAGRAEKLEEGLPELSGKRIPVTCNWLCR